MDYTIIEKQDNQTLIEVEHNGEIHRSVVVVADESQFEEAAQSFVDTVKVPREFPPPEPAPDYGKMIADLNAKLEAQAAEIAALKAAP